MRKKTESSIFSTAQSLSRKARSEPSVWGFRFFLGWGVGGLLLGNSLLLGQEKTLPIQAPNPLQRQKENGVQTPILNPEEALNPSEAPVPAETLESSEAPNRAGGQKPDEKGAEAPNADEFEGAEDVESTEFVHVFQPVPRELRRSMEDARKLIEMERFAEAGRKLDEILGAEEDYFFLLESETDEGERYGGHFGNLQHEAERLLETIPSRGKELYETEFGAVARLLLEEALAQGDAGKLNQLSRRYFFTQAGREATFLLGLSLLDRRQFVSARKQFEKIRSFPEVRKEFEPALTLYLAIASLSGGPNGTAEEILRESIRDGFLDCATLRLGDQSAKDFPGSDGDSAEALAGRLQELAPELCANLPEELRKSWDLLLQNQARSVNQPGVSMPILTPVWKSSMVDDPEGNVLLTLLKAKNERQLLGTPLPSHSPLVVGKTVLMRTLWNLSAVDLETGKRLWSSPSANYAEIRNQLLRLDESQLGAILGLPPSHRIHQLMAGLIQRQIFGERIYCELASDGKSVFCVEDTLHRYVPSRDSILVRRLGAPNAAFPEKSNENDLNSVPNRLVRYDIRTGKLLWHLGGSASSWSLEESGAMFLGAPLCVDDALYALVWRQGQIRLLAVAVENGKTLWSQTLCLAPTAFQANPTPCSPRLCEGTLVCPTPNQLIVGVDLVSRKLAWANVYGNPMGSNEEARYFDSRVGSLLQSETPIQPGSEIATFGEKVLYLGMNDMLVCLDGLTGKTFWRKPVPYVQQTSGANILFVEGDRVAVLSGSEVLLYSLENGELFRREKLATFGKPTGRGFVSDGSCFLPFENERIVRFDVKSWKALEVVSLCESGELGNLVPAGDFILSQGATDLTAFVQEAAASEYVRKTREKDLDSPEALQVEAELLWKDGKLKEAVALLKSGGEFTRETYRKRLLEIVETATDVDLESWFSEMETPAEQFRFIQRAVERMEATKRWDVALSWIRKACQMSSGFDRTPSPSFNPEADSVSASEKAPEALKTPETKRDDSLAAEGFWMEVPAIANDEVKAVWNWAQDAGERTVEDSDGGRRFVNDEYRSLMDSTVFQSFDVWLSERLSQIAQNAPVDSEARRELVAWSSAESARLHEELERLKEDGDFSSERGERLLRELAKFRIRFSFQQNVSLDDDYFQLAKLGGNIPALEAFVQERENDSARAAAALVKIFEELSDHGRAALYLRFLESQRPSEKLLDGKTAREWRLGLSVDHPVRRILDLEQTEFPAGRIVVTSEKKRGDEETFSSFSRLEVVRSQETSPFQNMVFRGAFGAEAISGEDTLGRRLFKINLGDVAEFSQGPSTWASQGFSVWGAPVETNQIKFQGSSIFHAFRSLAFYSPKILPISQEGNERREQDPIFVAGKTLSRLRSERNVEPYLLPMMERVEKENLPIFDDRGFELGNLIPGNSLTLLQFSDGSGRGIDRGNLLELWNYPRLNSHVLYSESAWNDLMERNGKFILFRTQGLDRERWVPFCTAFSEAEWGDWENLPETMRENGNEAAGKGATAEIPAEFSPFEIFRDILPVELATRLKKLGHDVAKARLDDSASLPLIPQLDSRTGRIVGFQKCPQMEIVPVSGACVLLLDLELGFGKFDFEALKFDWFVAWNPRLSREKLPYYLSGGKYFESVKKLAFANWKRQVEIFDLETGDFFTAEFPLPDTGDLPDGRKTIPGWNLGDEVELDLIPDKSGAFTLILGHGEYYEPSEEPSESKISEDEASVGGKVVSELTKENRQDGDLAPGREHEVDASENSPSNAPENVGDDGNLSGFSDSETDALDSMEAVTEYSLLEGESFPLNHALVCLFDAKGKPVWEKSRFVQKSYFLKNLPSGIPVIGLGRLESVFASRQSRQKEATAAWRFWDRRNGRLIYDAKLPLAQILFMEGDPAEKKARLLLTGMTLNFAFSDEPYGEGDVVQSDSRAALREQIRRREMEFKSSQNFLLANERSFTEEKRAFERKKDWTEDEKNFFDKRFATLEKELNDHRAYLEKETKAIQALREELAKENARHGGPLPGTPGGPEASGASETSEALGTSETPETPETPEAHAEEGGASDEEIPTPSARGEEARDES